MTVLSRAEDLNRAIEEKALRLCHAADSILFKLRHFKENKFRPKIHQEDESSSGNESQQDKQNRERSPSKFLDKMNKLNEEEDNIALLKLIRGGYID